MMKRLLTLLVFLCVYVATQAQINLYSNDFESYTVGGKIAQQAGSTWWTTWSNTPGSSEDAAISSTQSHSTSKSIYVVNDNDLVWKFKFKRSTGRYKIEWWYFVESGKVGYFNVLNTFNGSNSIWGFQAIFRNDSIIADAGGVESYKGLFPRNVWKKIDFVIDLEDDFATLFIDEIEAVSYKWSKGAEGNGTTDFLNAVNFYGYHTVGTAGYYVDDVKLDSITDIPQKPINLTAAINVNDIDVSWTSPAPSPDSYALSRNGDIIANQSQTNYTDVEPWPNRYIYSARAFYNGVGYSHASNEDTVTIPGGVVRNLVLMEGGTGTWCQYCPGAAMGLRDLIEVNNKDATAIEYHDGDSYENASATTRLTYYAISSFPTVIADGGEKSEGGSATQSLYPIYLPMYEKCIAQPSFYNLYIDIIQTDAAAFQATINIKETFKAYASGWKLHTALTESEIPQNWGNQTKVDFCCRGMFPSASGTSLDFSVDDSLTKVINFNTSTYNLQHCKFVVFVQHNSSKLVAQTLEVDLSQFVGMSEIAGDKINIYPNPVTDHFTLNSNGQGFVEVYDITGKLVLRSGINCNAQSFDVSKLAKGVYAVKVNNGKNTFTQKIVKQ